MHFRLWRIVRLINSKSSIYLLFKYFSKTKRNIGLYEYNSEYIKCDLNQ